jgi:hypothetical protein
LSRFPPGKRRKSENWAGSSVAERCPYKAALLHKYLENRRAGERMTVPVPNTCLEDEPTEDDLRRARAFFAYWYDLRTEPAAEDVADLIATIRFEQREADARICANVANECDHSDDKHAEAIGAAVRVIEKAIREQKP